MIRQQIKRQCSNTELNVKIIHCISSVIWKPLNGILYLSYCMIHNIAVHQKLLVPLEKIAIFLRGLRFLLPIAGRRKLPLLVGMNLLSYKQFITGRILDQTRDHEINSRLAFFFWWACNNHNPIPLKATVIWCFNTFSFTDLSKLLSKQSMVGDWLSENTYQSYDVAEIRRPFIRTLIMVSRLQRKTWGFDE